ncbi:MAG: DNA-directed RNA polymerase subunit H [Nitrososphaeria archaeon]|jgi:DNA-directed RNA polymerase subunit H
MSKKTEKKDFLISDHVLVPKHEILSAEEAQKILDTFHIKPHQLPYIFSLDPAIRELGVKPGDIIKITRKSEVSGVVSYYRYVIE